MSRREDLDTRAGTNLASFLLEQREATGVVPTDRTLVVERFRDELGDWRVVLLSPYGRRVHAPWALAVGARILEQFGIDGSVVASDDGIVARLPDTGGEPPGAELFVFEADELDQIVTIEVGGSALFASRFRECAARALLLPRRNPGARAPLWQQRQRSAQLLEVARKYPDFPILLETARECLQDVYDLPSLGELTRRIASREVQIAEVTTERASPFAQTLLFGYVASFLYEGDTPLAERRAAALTLDPTLLAELLGRAELRELLDPEVIERTEAELQRLADDRKVSGVEGVADLLRILGPLTTDEVQAAAVRRRGRAAAGRSCARADEPSRWRSAATCGGSPSRTPRASATRWAPPCRSGVAEAHLTSVDDPLADLLSRYARTHGPFTTAEAAAGFGLGTAVVADVLRRLARDGRLVEGEFRPQATGSEWVEPGVLRRLRSRSLAAARKQVEPVDPAALARFLPSWQGVGGNTRGVEGVLAVIDQLAGLSLPASAWESLVLPARVADYSPAMLDELLGAGEVVWTGAGTLPGSDGWVQLHPADLVLPVLRDVPEPDAVGQAVLDALDGGGAFLFRQLATAVGEQDDSLVAEALWQLVWSGRVAGDTFAPLRAMLGSRGAHRSASRSPRARLRSGRGRAASPRLALQGPPTVSGRWFRLDDAESDPTKLQLARTEALLARYGVVTRGSVVAEQTPGGFAATYRVLRELEQTGACLRGYYVDTLGAAQFASPATVDRLRSHQHDDDQPVEGPALVLAATDPANPFGAALPWPDVVDPDESSRHRPARKAGSLAVIHDGHAVLYLERGGRKALVLHDDPASTRPGRHRTRRPRPHRPHPAPHRRDGRREVHRLHRPRGGVARGRVRPAPEGPAPRCPKVTPSGALHVA